MADVVYIDTKADQAALAFSQLSSHTAEFVNRRLSIAERKQLREGLSRTRCATDEQRRAAYRALARAVARGTEWPVPASHDEADCPFTPLGLQPRFAVVDVLDRIAHREPIQVVVTLCHLGPDVRDEIWGRLKPDTKARVKPHLNEVHLVSLAKTRDYARDINSRLSRAIRFPSKDRAGR